MPRLAPDTCDTNLLQHLPAARSRLYGVIREGEPRSGHRCIAKVVNDPQG